MAPQSKMLSDSSSSPSTLQSLPFELLQQICNHLDRPSAICLASTAHAFIGPTENIIWAELIISLHRWYGERPLVQPYASDDHRYDMWKKKVSQKAAAEYAVALKASIKGVLLGAGKRRMAKVVKVTLVPVPAVLHGMLTLLDIVSPHVQSLEIARRPYWSGEPLTPPFHQTIDFHLLSAGLSFPALTHVRLGSFAFDYAETLLLLCNAAPALTVLLVDAWHFHAPDDPAIFPGIAHRTRIESLRFSFNIRDPPLIDSDGDSGGFDYEAADDEEDDAAEPLLALLEHSPCLRQLSMYYFGQSIMIHRRVADVLVEHEHLQDLHLRFDSCEIEQEVVGVERISCLRRVAMEVHSWSEIFNIPLNLPNLEVWCLLRIPLSIVESPTRYSPAPIDVLHSSQVYTMIPSFAAQLRLTPHLHTIHILEMEPDKTDLGIFDQLDDAAKSGGTTGRIRSFCNGGNELLQASFWLEYEEVSDEVCLREPFQPWISPLVPYTAQDGSRRQRGFAQMPESKWYHFTDYEGSSVPLLVIEEMRQVQGATESEWQGGGIEVGDKAWAVLTEWKRGIEGM